MLLVFIFLLANYGYAHNTPAQPCCQETITINSCLEGHQWIKDIAGKEHLGKFNKQRLCLLDHKQNVFLFRGNVSEDKKEFNYDELIKAIKEYLAELNIPIRDDFKIMDISFLNYFKESEQIEIEKRWFEENPDKGCFWLYPLYGSLLNPIDMPKLAREFYISHEDIDGQKMLIECLQKFISTPCNSDMVYYIHCNAGKDRTGECSTNYMMANGYSYKDSVAVAEAIAHRKLHELSMNAIRWYAFYLRDIEKKTWIGPIE